MDESDSIATDCNVNVQLILTRLVTRIGIIYPDSERRIYLSRYLDYKLKRFREL